MRTRVTLFALVILVCLPLPALALNGPVSGTWTMADPPAIIDGDISVPAGETLTIEAGVSVMFSGPFSLTVAGTLTAMGTQAQPIVFTRAEATEAAKWRGIKFDSADDASILEYCVIEYTRKDGSYYADVRGGGVTISACSPTIRYCTVRHNYACNANRNGAGGAIFVDDGSTSLIEHNHFANNESDSGGAINVGADSRPTIRYNLIENNTAHSSGGGIYLAAWAEATIDSNIIRQNTAGYWGGGGITLWNNTCSGGDCTDVFNNVLFANIASSTLGEYFGNGGAIYCRYNKSNQFNNTIVGNTAQGDGGGIYVLNQGNTYPEITNTIVWNNSASRDDQISLQESSGSGNTYYSEAEITHSNVQGGWSGTGNINAQPLFRRPAIGDFLLLSGSPGIDAGDNSVPNLPAVDIDLRNRIIDGEENGSTVVDTGAYEFDPNAPLLGDIDGSGVVNLTDTILILQLLSGQNIGLSGDLTGIDVDGDGRVGIAEAMFTLQSLALQ